MVLLFGYGMFRFEDHVFSTPHPRGELEFTWYSPFSIKGHGKKAEPLIPPFED